MQGCPQKSESHIKCHTKLESHVFIVAVLLAPVVFQKLLVATILDLAKPQRTLVKTCFCYGASLWRGNRVTSFHFPSSGRCQEYSHGSNIRTALIAIVTFAAFDITGMGADSKLSAEARNGSW